MKRKIPILIALALVLVIGLFTACTPRQAEQKLDRIEDAVEYCIDTAKDAMSNARQESILAGSKAALTAEQAQTIAVEHAGLTLSQVSRLQTKYEIDDGVPQYDVEFRYDGVEYNYEIHADTGKILSFEKDR